MIRPRAVMAPLYLLSMSSLAPGAMAAAQAETAASVEAAGPPMVGAPPRMVKHLTAHRVAADGTAMSPVIHRTTYWIMMPGDPTAHAMKPAPVTKPALVTKSATPPN